MTVKSYFDRAHSSASVAISGADSAVTLRGSNFTPIVSGSTFVPFPAGTVAGDIAVYIGSSPWDFNGGASSVAGQYIELQYAGGSGTPISGWSFYIVVTAAQITAGGVTLSSPSASSGYIGCATFDGSENPSVSLVEMFRPTGTTASQAISLAGRGANDTFLVFAAVEQTTTIDFAVVTETYTAQAGGFTGSFCVYQPGARGGQETITYGSSPGGNYSVVVRVSRAPQNQGLTVASTATSAAKVGTRFAVGALYYEAVIDLLTGTMGVGICNPYQGFGAAVLGTGVHNFIYRNTGVVVCNGVTLATISSYTTGDRVSVAYHPSAKLVWFKVNAGSWNNDGTANPATFTGGIDVSSFYGGQPYPALEFSTRNGTITGFLAAASWSYSPPSGFNSIEEVVIAGPVFDSSGGQVPGLTGDNLSEWRARADLPQDNHSASISFPAGPVKTIAGEVQEESVGVEGRLVRLYNKRTGDFVGEARTNGSGEFVIPARDPNLPHFVVAFDDDVAPDYNAKIYDNVIPQ